MTLNKIFKSIVVFIDAAEEFVVYFIQLCLYDRVHNYFKKEERLKPLDILVNGPSLKDSLVDIISDKSYASHDLMTVNFMTNEDSFLIIKPK